jgi:hypothetical protein
MELFCYDSYYNNAPDPNEAPYIGSLVVPITLFKALPPVINSFTAPSSIYVGSSSTLAWNTTNATNCDMSGDLMQPGLQPNSNLSVTPVSSGPKTYTLTCKNGAGTATSSSKTVDVLEVPVSGQCGNADGHVFAPGDSVYAPYIQCSVGIPSNASVPSFPAQGGFATWDCLGSFGGSTQSCGASRLTLPTINSFIATSTLPLHVGDKAILKWTTSNVNVNGCEWNSGPWTGSGLATSSSGYLSDFLLTSGNKTFGIKCTGPGGSVTLSSNPINVLDNPVNGVCGAAVNGHNFTGSETSYSALFPQCSVGNPSSTLFPASGETKTWTCSGLYGGNPSGTCSASHIILPTIDSFTASPLTLYKGGKATLKWTTSNVNVNGCEWWSGPWTGSGLPADNSTGYLSDQLNIAETKTFGIKCTGPSGTVTRSSNSIDVLENPVDGVCGTAISSNHVFGVGELNYGTFTQCSVGSPVPAGEFPTPGNTKTWTCSGLYGGNPSVSCSASRLVTSSTVCGSPFVCEPGENFANCPSDCPFNYQVQ